MQDLVRPVDYGCDLVELKNIVKDLLENPIVNKMAGFSIQHRANVEDPWKLIDGLESLKFYNEKESDFSKINKIFIGTGFEKIIKDFNLFRCRVMVMKNKTCYTLHHDNTKRLHIPIVTKKNKGFFFFPRTGYHYFLNEGCTYLVDTTETHTFVNTADHLRVHLVGCINE